MTLTSGDGSEEEDELQGRVLTRNTSATLVGDAVEADGSLKLEKTTLQALSHGKANALMATGKNHLFLPLSLFALN